jgi:hypothetical protein
MGQCPGKHHLFSWIRQLLNHPLVTGLQLADRVLQFGNSGIVVRGKIVCQSITLHIQVVSKISDLLGRPTLESVSGAASSSACHPGRAAETAGTCHPRRAEAAGSPTCRYPGRAEAASSPGLQHMVPASRRSAIA